MVNLGMFKLTLAIKPIYSLVMLFGTLLCITLGFWQFFKAQQFEHKDVPSVSIQGQLLPSPLIFLDNRTQAGVAGYHLYSIFRTHAIGKQTEHFLLNRGFVALDAHTRLPIVRADDHAAGHFGLGALANENTTKANTNKAISKTVRLEVRKALPAQPMLLSTSMAVERLPAMGDQVWRVQTIDISTLSELTGVGLNQNILMQIHGEGMMQPLLTVEPYMTRHKHLAYAVQWWLLAVAAVVIWSWSSVRRTVVAPT